MDKEIKELQKKAGQEIKRARLQKGWSQHKLAEKADLSNRHLQQIEDGVVNASLAIIVRIFRVLGLSVDALIFPDDSDFLSSTANIRIKYTDCTPSERKLLINTMEYMATQIIENRQK